MLIPDLHELRQKKQFRAVSITCNWSYRRQRVMWQKTNPCVLLSEHVAPGLSEIVWCFGCCQIQIAFVYTPVYLSMFIPDLHELRQKKQFRAVSITCNWSYRRQRVRWQKTNPCVLLSETVRNSMMFGCCQIQITFVYRHLYIYQCLSQICMSCDKRSSFRAVSITCNWSYRRHRERWQKTNPCVLLSEHVAPDCQK